MTASVKAVPDSVAVQAVVRDYFHGLYHFDEALLRKAFDPRACLFGHLEGVFIHSTLDQWLGKIGAKPVPAKIGEAFDMHIVSTDIVGDAALVKVKELYRGLRFTDYLSLLRIDGRWVIVNKHYHHD
jgi:hypothetical protein